MQKIKDLRLKIDEIDKNLLDLFIERLKIVKEIGEVKQKNGMEIIDDSREQEVLSHLVKRAKNKGVNPEVVKKLWRVLMEISYEVEEKNGNS